MTPLAYAVLDGEHVFPGATLWSNFHSKSITVVGIWRDSDGEVYLEFKGGNINVKYCEWIPLNEAD